MRTTTGTEPPLFCTLDTGEFRKRLGWISDLNRTALLDARRDGARLVLTYRADRADRVRKMIRQESECCGFLSFALVAGREAVTLTITAPDSATDILVAIFDPFISRAERVGSCGCASGSACKGETDDNH
ncbi:MAG: hypothetical protein GC186_19940 [Rhodobacteraceae bacterium]|nr:hypothetical protein [Paracoccaceae bacterium]